MSTPETIAVLGLGTMGRAVADRMADCGHEVTVWNRSGSPEGWRPRSNQTVARSAAEAAAQADVILLALADDESVKAVSAQVAPALRPAGVLVNLSTVHPETARAVAALVPGGAAFVDAPIMGSRDAVANGEAGILIGADDPDAAELVTSLLEAVGNPRSVGAVGDAAALKLALMAAVIPSVLAVGEALHVGKALGLTEDAVLQGLLSSPLAAVTKRATSTTAYYPVRLAAKDITIATRTDQRPLAKAALDLLRAGQDDLDLGALARTMAE